MTEPDPRQRLTAAVAALCDPTTVRVDRLATTDTDRDAVRATNAEAAANHRDQIAFYRRDLARYQAQRNDAMVQRVQELIDHREARHAEAIEARRVIETSLPSLLDQVLDAVESSTSTGGAPSVGASRSPIGLAASALIHEIERTVGWQRDQPLADVVRAWAYSEAVDLIEQWAVTARGIVEPSRTAEARAACPVCGNRWVWAIEDGERVRRAAISINLSAGIAVCLVQACGTTWDRAHFPLLAAALMQDVDERKARATARQT